MIGFHIEHGRLFLDWSWRGGRGSFDLLWKIRSLVWLT